MCSASGSNRLYSNLEGWRTTAYACTAKCCGSEIRTHVGRLMRPGWDQLQAPRNKNQRSVWGSNPAASP
jgi:hypothetical protein